MRASDVSLDARLPRRGKAGEAGEEREEFRRALNPEGI